MTASVLEGVFLCGLGKGSKGHRYATMFKIIKVVSRELAKCLCRQPIENKTIGLGVGSRAAKSRGNKKMKATPTMLMKTKEEGLPNLATPTILLKTRNLISLSHDVYETIGS